MRIREGKLMTTLPSFTKKNLEDFTFRNLHPKIQIGTASDRYAGWIGQIYSGERYKDKMTRRTHAVAGKTFTEEVLPVESVKEYFEHFSILEIDYTFYRLLLDESGKPAQNYHVLGKYRGQIKDEDSLILKVPQIIFARRLRKGKGFVQNDSYLNAEIFTNRFYKPALEILGASLRGFIFEQEYHPKSDRIPIDELAQSLDEFFKKIPKDTRYHVELRTDAYLKEPVFEILERHGVGLVLSHWTWLPPLWKQFSKSGERVFNSGKQAIIRLITPLRMSYEDSYGKAFPFDKPVDGMLNPQMVEDTLRIIQEAIKREKRIAVIINNRAGGNAPLIARLIAEKFMVT
jgi:uncharacterized protein YecE (DUF72 family)